MVDPTPSDYHLTYLRERWERDRSSRVFLQLAEEYRRRGLHAEALEVLGVGLQHHPGYLAAQVSLGRCLIEAREPGRAAEVLEGVLAQDPTQAVAIRLLVTAALEMRDPARAREAIDRCRLLGVPPAELQAFEDRLRSLEEQQPEGAADNAEEQPGREAEPPAAAERAASPPPEPTAAEPAEDLSEAEESSVLSPTAGASEVFPAGAGALANAAPATFGEVFPLPRLAASTAALPAPPRDGGRRLVRLGGAMPFALAGEALAPAPRATEVFALRPTVAPAEPAQVQTLPAPEPMESLAGDEALAAVPIPVPAPETGWGTEAEPRLPAAAEAEPAAESEPEAEPEPEARPEAEPSVPQLAATASAEAEDPVAALPEPSWSEPAAPLPVPEAEEPAVTAAEPPSAPAAPSAVAAAGVEIQPSGSLPAHELRPSDQGTATLGELYLRQGYLVEAERIFREVLARDGENLTALEGLEAIGKRRAASLSASELLTGDETEVRGLSARKILLLQRYLQTLRRGAANDVPGTPE